MRITSITAFLALICCTSSAQLVIVISPIQGDPDNYLLQASGTGGIVAVSIGDGSLELDSSAFLQLNASPAAGLSYGGQAVTTASPAAFTVFNFGLAGNVSSGSAYSFSGDSTTVDLGILNYLDIFNPGAYTITNSDGIFGDDATGTVEILSSPVPEPSSFPFLAGLCALGVGLLRRRRSSRSR